MNQSKNFILVFFILLSVLLVLSGCNTPASEKIIGKWSGETEKNKTIVKEKAETSMEQEMMYEMYSAIKLEFTKDTLKTTMGDFEAIMSYKVLSESKNDLTIQTEDGEQMVFSINGDNEILILDEKNNMYMVKVL